MYDNIPVATEQPNQQNLFLGNAAYTLIIISVQLQRSVIIQHSRR